MYVTIVPLKARNEPQVQEEIFDCSRLKITERFIGSLKDAKEKWSDVQVNPKDNGSESQNYGCFRVEVTNHSEKTLDILTIGCNIYLSNEKGETFKHYSSGRHQSSTFNAIDSKEIQNWLARSSKPLMLIGEPATGKTDLISELDKLKGTHPFPDGYHKKALAYGGGAIVACNDIPKNLIASNWYIVKLSKDKPPVKL